MTRPPFAAVRLSLVLLLASVLLAAAGILWGRHQANEAATALQQHQAALDRARQQLGHSYQQQRLIATHLSAYQALAARGFVGAEDRLAWIEAAQLANREAGLYGLDYHLAPRTASPDALAQGLPLGQTLMTLTLPLLVETDLPRYLDALQAHAPGVMRVQQCRLTRRDNGPFEVTSQPRLQAECELLWFTLATEAGNPP